MNRKTIIYLSIILFIFPFVPVVMATFIRLVGSVSGCSLAGDVCSLFGVNMGDMLKHWVSMSWGAIYWALLPMISGGLLTLFVLDNFRQRFLIGGVAPAVSLVAVILLPVFLVVFSAHDKCMINEGGVGDCVVWGTSMKDTFHTAMVAPWFVMFAVPISVMWIILVSVSAFFLGRYKKA
ncbi:MAG: hypothetical protein ACRBBN_02655 [Methyloligellaceae bacterium]